MTGVDSGVRASFGLLRIGRAAWPSTIVVTATADRRERMEKENGAADHRADASSAEHGPVYQEYADAAMVPSSSTNAIIAP
jgi:hypothetical protein